MTNYLMGLSALIVHIEESMASQMRGMDLTSFKGRNGWWSNVAGMQIIHVSKLR